jgi:uncharacterized protein (DUF4415 family)
MKTISLKQIREMSERDELYHSKDAAIGESLGRDFWAKAVVVAPPKPKSVHLKIGPEVFDFFVSETNGKGHITRMQEVLKAYMRAKAEA